MMLLSLMGKGERWREVLYAGEGCFPSGLRSPYLNLRPLGYEHNEVAAILDRWIRQ
jgi:hypothetical protein